MEGDAIAGISLATYRTHLTATFDKWRGSSLTERASERLGPVPYTYEVELDHWSFAVSPALGGNAFGVSPISTRITGILVLPPSFGVHAYKENAAMPRG